MPSVYKRIAMLGLAPLADKLFIARKSLLVEAQRVSKRMPSRLELPDAGNFVYRHALL
jgi:hypothetical protein